MTINTRGTNVPLEVTAHMTVDGRQIVQTWSVPGVPAWQRGTHPDGWRTRPALGSVLVRLPGGEGLWIDVQSGDVADVPGATVKHQASFFYFVDSASDPRVLTDYHNSATPTRCPKDFRIRNCEINITTRRLPDGPPIIGRDVAGGDGIGFGYPDRLRTAKLAAAQKAYFLSLTGMVHYGLEGAKDDPLLGPQLQGLDRPTVLRLDGKSTTRIRELANRSTKLGGPVHLRYLGEGRWAVPDQVGDPYQAAAITSVGYRIQIDPADLHCCSSPTDRILPKAVAAHEGRVEWRGHGLSYDTAIWNGPAADLRWNVLYDPRDGTAVILRQPGVKRVWQVPPDVAGGAIP